MQGGFFLRKKPLSVRVPVDSRIENAVAGVDEPKGPSKKQKQEIAKLETLSGPDFDTAYIQAMAKQQQHDLKEFKSEASSGQNPNIQQAAKQDEPVLTEHFEVLQKLAQAHNVTLESRK